MVITGIARRMELAAYHRCDVLVCVSESLKQFLLAAAGIDPEKVVVSPNGVDTERFDPAVTRARRHAERFVVGWVGNMYAWAGLDLLLEAVASLRLEGLEMEVVLVGDGIERGRLEALARRLEIRRQVRFIDRVPWDEVPAHLVGFDLCYSGQVPVDGTGAMYHSPLKLYEYMAMARPVLASAFADARELVEHGTTDTRVADTTGTSPRTGISSSSRLSVTSWSSSPCETAASERVWSSRLMSVPRILPLSDTSAATARASPAAAVAGDAVVASSATPRAATHPHLRIPLAGRVGGRVPPVTVNCSEDSDVTACFMTYSPFLLSPR